MPPGEVTSARNSAAVVSGRPNRSVCAASSRSSSIAADPAKRAKIADELADVVVYALEFAKITGLDVAAAIDRKMAANAVKYPVEKARGRSDKYDEL